MKRFIKLVALFLIPILLLGGSCFIVLYRGGELFVSNSLKPLQENQLLGLAYTDIRAPYKYAMTEYYQPEVVALGSSRIMQIKRNIINEHYSFYNAGGAAGNLYEYELFLDQIHFTPKLIIMNLDQWAFNPNYIDQRKAFNKKCFVLQETGFVYKYKKLLIDIVLGKINFSVLFDKDNTNIGFSGRINGSGFANDGSYYYGNYINNPSAAEDYNFKDTYDRIKNGRSRFEYCDEADTTNLATIDTFLSKCHDRGIKVIAFLPPFAPSICEKMNNSGQYNYMKQIYNILSPIFEKFDNCFIYDYTDMTSMGVHNYDFIDGFHGAENIYSLIIKDIVNHNKDVSDFFKTNDEIDTIYSLYKQQNIRYHSF